MKKKISLLLAVILLFSFTAQVSFASDYETHWAKDVISKWIEAEKISGYTDGTFKPDNVVTRAEFVTILANVIPYEPGEYKDVSIFKDVSEKHWFVGSVQKLLSLEIIAEDDYFNPYRELTREEAMTMIGRAFSYYSEDTDVLKSFKDYEEISGFAVDFVAALAEAGIVSGFSDGTIRPKAKITRAESVKILDGFNLVNDKYSLAGIMERIYKGADTQFPMVGNFEITKENSEFYLGIPEMEFEEAIASEALMGSQAHSVCLVRVKEGTDVEKVKEEIRTKVDPRKWICVGVEREDVIVINQENLILLIIDQFAPEALRDSFLSLDVKKNN